MSKWEFSAVYTTPIWSEKYPATNYKIDNGAKLSINNVGLNFNRSVIKRPKWRLDAGLGLFHQDIRFKNILYHKYYNTYGRCNMYATTTTLIVNINSDFKLKDVFNRKNYIRIGVSIGSIQRTKESYSADHFPYLQNSEFDRKNKTIEWGFAPQVYSRFQCDYVFNVLKENTKPRELNVLLGLGSAIVDGNAFNRYFIDMRCGIAYRW